MYVDVYCVFLVWFLSILQRIFFWIWWKLHWNPFSNSGTICLLALNKFMWPYLQSGYLFWIPFNFLMNFFWVSFDFLMFSWTYLLQFLWFLMNLLWFSFEFHVNSFCRSYAFPWLPMIFLWISHEILMKFLWIPYAVLMRFEILKTT